jgi:hypothetical protein
MIPKSLFLSLSQMGAKISKPNKFLIFKEFVNPSGIDYLLPNNITHINNWHVLLLNEYTKLGGSRVIPPPELNKFTSHLLSSGNLQRKVANYTFKSFESLIKNKIISTPLYTGCLNLYTLVTVHNTEYPNNDRIHRLLNKLLALILPKADCVENNVFRWSIHWKVVIDLPTLLFCIRNYDHLPYNLLDMVNLTHEQKNFLRKNIHSLDKKTGEMVLASMLNW